MKKIVLLFVFGTFFFFDAFNQENSPLQSGDVYKVGITESGIYQISGKQLSEAFNISLSNINPKAIQLFVGNAGRLPENLDEKISTLHETPIEISGIADGTFNENAKIIFFADGPNTWKYENNAYGYSNNIYSDTNYVFIKLNGTNGKRITTASQPNTVEYTSGSYDQLQRHEQDRVNLLGSFASAHGSGQDWYGEVFASNSTIDFSSSFDFQGLIPSPVQISYKMASRSKSRTKSTLQVGENKLNTGYTFTYINDEEARYAQTTESIDTFNLSSSPSVQLTYEKSNSSDKAWLDYIQIINRRNVALYGTQTIIQDNKSKAYSSAAFDGNISKNATIWNITVPESILQITHTNGTWKYTTNDTIQRFVVFTNPKTPTLLHKINNTNISNIADVDMVIIYPTIFEEEAKRLAQHRAETSNLHVEIVNIQDVYNEYSSGKLDPTAIRNFCKQLKERSDRFEYLLLFGDGSYDYKNQVEGLPNHNFIPVYETKESLDPISAFPSDDYFTIFSPYKSGTLRGNLEISVGRLPVSTIEQARNAVDKIIHYDTNEHRFGNWRLKLGFTADDEDGNTHINQADRIAEQVATDYPIFNQQKIYLDAYPQASTAGGDRYYDVSNAINQNVQNGQRILNYLGHGGPNGWAQERILKKSDIDTWENKDQLPLLITATCSFSGYDDPSITSAGEYAFLKKNGGAIALYTTVRAVYANQNKILTQAIFNQILQDSINTPIAHHTLGNVIKLAKNAIASSISYQNSRKFTLLGDPSISFAPPKHLVQTTAVNDKPIEQAKNDTIHALENVKISGILTDKLGNLLDDFNGELSVTVFDKISTLETLANDEGSKKRNFNIYKNILFKGNTIVIDGTFSIEFIVPKDINYTVGNGRVSYYAHNGKTDAAGFYNELLIGSSPEDVIIDDTPPAINAYMNDTSFTNESTISPNGTLLLQLSDNKGINVSGTSIGHDLTAILDDTYTYVLNDFYETEVGDFTKGTVQFPLNNLAEGWHTITVKAWDVANNNATTSIRFNVQKTFDINTFAYPNPTVDDVNIVIEQEFIGKKIDLNIQMYDQLGRIVMNTKEKMIPTGNSIVYNISADNTVWSRMNSGIYFYKINITCNELNTSRTSELEKLVISN